MNTPVLTRRRALAGIGAGAATLTLPGFATSIAAQVASAGSPQALLDAIAWDMLEADPEQATSLGVDSGAHAAVRGKLGDRSPEGVARKAAMLSAALENVHAVDLATLDPSTRTSFEVVKTAFATALEGFALPFGDVAVGGWRNTPYVVIQNVGAYLDTPRFLDGDHQVKTAQDAEFYLERLSAMPAQLDGELARIKSATAVGLIPPSFLLDKAIGQMRQSIASAQQGGDMVQSLVRRTSGIPGDWEARARTIVTGTIVPALDRQLAELVAQRTRATTDAGMWARPDGENYYLWALRASTTTTRTPDEIHAQGKEELAALHARMDPILRKLGYASGSVGARMAALGNDPRYQFSNDDKGREEVLALMREKIEFIREKMPLAFRNLVPGNVEIRRLPLAEEAGAPGAYGGAGSIDGTVPGKVWVNLGDVSRHNRFSVPDLVFHEGIPGHVWQGEYANRLPLIRSILSFNAYSEGWALYAQQLADELGAYDDDPVGRLGYLQGLAFRACRMVVDTGLHAKRWGREQAINWFAEANGSGAAELGSEIDRYCSWPGQACGYKIGHIEINAQRDRAKAELATRFDLRDFNQAVVDGGNVPLNVLAKNVTRYIEGVPG
ncbi:MAG: DUF885 domain-containing protein [Novosphingobium sp.]